jgi:mycothiol synthase
MVSMRLRAPVPDDAPAVLAVLAARDLADLGEVDYTLEDLRDEWRGSDLELEHDARVIEADDGRIVAYAVVRRPGTLAVVAPEHEGQGIGSRLLEWTERRERERGRDTHRQWVAAANAAARSLLTAAGYRRSRSNWRMVRSLADVGPAPPAPAGYRLRPVDAPRDAAALHLVDAQSFAGAPDYVPESPAEFTQEHLEAHDFDPGLSLVATSDEEVVGFALARRWRAESVGYVDILAVRPDHQGRGLGTALLRGAFAGFAAAGLREAQLGVDSGNARGLRVYERAGMTVRHRADIYERPVR